MQIVIDIPEERLKSIRRFGIKENEVYMLEKAILECKKLPKHHGRLIDGDELESRMKIGYRIVRNAKTIIEADEAACEDFVGGDTDAKR